MEDFSGNRSFLTPAFEMHLDGSPLGRRTLGDILDISFVDDLAAINSFEFTVNDWDPNQHEPVYSFPWDQNDGPRRYFDSDDTVPDLQPGAKLSLFLGYQDEGNLPQIMDGVVVSVATSFPSSGLPVAKIRVLDAFQQLLQDTWVEGLFSGTPKEIVDQICSANGVSVVWDTPDNEGEPAQNMQLDGPLFDEVQSRAKDYGLSLITQQGATGPELYLARPTPYDTAPVAIFEWGRSLIDFTPSLSSSALFGEIEGRGGDPNAETGKRSIIVSHTWDSADVDLDTKAFGAETFDISRLLGNAKEVIKPDDGDTEEKVAIAVNKRFLEMAEGMITATGTVVGLPELRAGTVIEIAKAGRLYSGLYRITQSTHSYGASGYTTSFAATKKVLK